jgi:hypothetical protein
MTRQSGTHGAYRLAADAALGLSFFVLALVTIIGTARLTHWASSAAYAGGIIQVVQQPKVAATSEQVTAVALRLQPAKASAEAGKLMSVAILSGVFALMFAFNLAFFRHIRKAYRAPRSGLGPYARWSGSQQNS